MKKKVLLSMALLSAVVTVGSAPLTSYAAEAKATQISTKNGYTIIMGQGLESLNQTLKGLGVTVENSGSFCPNINIPVVGAPDVNVPDIETPDAEAPDVNVPETPNSPDVDVPETSAPETPNSPGVDVPETSVPETPNAPGLDVPETSVPETPNAPGVDVPETSVPESPSSPDVDVPEISVPETPDKEETDTDVPDAAKLSYAEQVAYLVNRERLLAGLLPLEIQTDITSAANVRAQEIKQQFSHTRPDGSNFSSVLKSQGVSFRGAGENIAWGQKSPEAVMEAWMNSAGHRANILNNNFKNIGVGYYQDERGVNYWVQLFTY